MDRAYMLKCLPPLSELPNDVDTQRIATVKRSPEFRTYVRALCKGPCLAVTNHTTVLGGKTLDTDPRKIAWAALVNFVGNLNTADYIVRKWLVNPWELK